MYLLLYIITYVRGLKQNHATLQLSTSRQNKAWPQGSFLTGTNHHHSVVFHVFPSSSPSAPLVQRRKSKKCLLLIAEAPYFYCRSPIFLSHWCPFHRISYSFLPKTPVMTTHRRLCFKPNEIELKEKREMPAYMQLIETSKRRSGGLVRSTTYN